MDIAVTLVIQGLAFFAVAWLVMRFGWPHITAAIEARQKRIAAGLDAADRGRKEFDEAKVKVQGIIREARDKAAQIVEQASKRSTEIIDEAQHSAAAEGQRIVGQAHAHIALDLARARAALSKQVAKLAVQGASQLLEREIDPKSHAALLDKLELEIANG